MEDSDIRHGEELNPIDLNSIATAVYQPTIPTDGLVDDRTDGLTKNCESHLTVSGGVYATAPDPTYGSLATSDSMHSDSNGTVLDTADSNGTVLDTADAADMGLLFDVRIKLVLTAQQKAAQHSRIRDKSNDGGSNGSSNGSPSRPNYFSGGLRELLSSPMRLSTFESLGLSGIGCTALHCAVAHTAVLCYVILHYFMYYVLFSGLFGKSSTTTTTTTTTMTTATAALSQNGGYQEADMIKKQGKIPEANNITPVQLTASDKTTPRDTYTPPYPHAVQYTAPPKHSESQGWNPSPSHSQSHSQFRDSQDIQYDCSSRGTRY